METLLEPVILIAWMIRNKVADPLCARLDFPRRSADDKFEISVNAAPIHAINPHEFEVSVHQGYKAHKRLSA